MPGCSLLAQSYCRAWCPPAPGPQQPLPLHSCALPGSREEDKEPGPGTRPQPSPSPVLPPEVEPAVMFGKLLGRSAPEGESWGSRCRVCRRGGVEAAGSSRSRCWRGPHRHLPLVLLLLPARFRGGRLPFFFPSRHGGKCCAAHPSHAPPHKSAPSSRAGRRPGTAAIRSGECATGGRVPGQRRRDVPARGAEP